MCITAGMNPSHKNLFSMDKEDFLKKLSDVLTDKTLFCSKEILTAQEVARYMGVTMSQLYRLTTYRMIPYYKPTGKMCYFNRREIEEWLQNNRVAAANEIKEKAQAYCMKGGKR